MGDRSVAVHRRISRTAARRRHRARLSPDESARQDRAVVRSARPQSRARVLSRILVTVLRPAVGRTPRSSEDVPRGADIRDQPRSARREPRPAAEDRIRPPRFVGIRPVVRSSIADDRSLRFARSGVREAETRRRSASGRVRARSAEARALGEDRDRLSRAADGGRGGGGIGRVRMNSVREAPPRGGIERRTQNAESEFRKETRAKRHLNSQFSLCVLRSAFNLTTRWRFARVTLNPPHSGKPDKLSVHPQ